MANDMKRIRRELQREGWTIEMNSGHCKAYHPMGGFIVMSSTPSAGSAHRAARRDADKLHKFNMEKAGKP